MLRGNYHRGVVAHPKSVARAALLSVLAAAIMSPFPPLARAATIEPGDVVFVESGLTGPGQLDRVRPDTGAVKTVSDNARSVAAGGEADFSFPIGVTIRANGAVMVSDRDAFGTGGVIRVNPDTGAQHAVSSNAISIAAGGTAEFAEPGGLALLDKQLYVADFGAPAKVIRVSPTTGMELVTSDEKLVHPDGIAADPSSDALLIADADAFGGSGGVIRVKPSTTSQRKVSGGGKFDTPSGVALGSGGNLFVSDQEAFGGGGGVIRVDASTGAQRKVSAGDMFADPFGIGREPDGTLMVSDTNGSNIGAGTILRVNPQTGNQHLLAGGFDNPLGVTVAP